jgi:hypothetical protein
MNPQNDEGTQGTPENTAWLNHVHEERAKMLRWYLAAATVLTLGVVWDKLRKGRKR